MPVAFYCKLPFSNYYCLLYVLALFRPVSRRISCRPPPKKIFGLAAVEFALPPAEKKSAKQPVLPPT